MKRISKKTLICILVGVEALIGSSLGQFDFGNAAKTILILVIAIIATFIAAISLNSEEPSNASEPAGLSHGYALDGAWLGIAIGGFLYLVYQFFFAVQGLVLQQVLTNFSIAGSQGSLIVLQTASNSSPILLGMVSAIIGATILFRAQKPYLAAATGSFSVLAIAIFTQIIFVAFGSDTHLQPLIGYSIPNIVRDFLLAWAAATFPLVLGLILGKTARTVLARIR